MGELNEVLSQLDFEGEEDENNSTYFTAADDVSWAEHSNRQVQGVDEVEGDEWETAITPRREDVSQSSIATVKEFEIITSTPASSSQGNVIPLEKKISAVSAQKCGEDRPVLKPSNSAAEEGGVRAIFQTKAQRISKNIEASAAQSAGVFDQFFGVRIRNPKISSSTFNTYVDGMQKIRPSQLQPTTAPIGDWVTLGVVVSKSSTLKSANSNEYMFLLLGDLMNCQAPPIKVLMFGECVKEHWKIQLSTAIALLSPVYADANGSHSRGSNITVKLTKPSQLLSLGICPDFAYCKGKKRDGENCRNFVNASVSERCVYHIEATARQYASRRGAFSSTSSQPPKKWEKQNLGNAGDCGPVMVGPQRAAKPPQKLLTMTDVRKGQKSMATKSVAAVAKNENEELSKVLKTRADSLGARNLTKHRELQQREQDERAKTVGVVKVKSFKEFIASQPKDAANVNPTRPCLGRGIKGGEILLRSPPKKTSAQKAAAEAARKKAVEVLRKKSEKLSGKEGLFQKKATKRLAACDSSQPGPSGINTPGQCGVLKRAKFSNDELKALLNKKSSHESELKKEDQERESVYFDNMEKKEKVESFVTSVMEIKECNVITCKKCNYTARTQSDFCKINGHLVVRHKASKRFYRCRSCSRRIVCYELMPTKPCPSCGEKDFERVAMRDERRVKLPEEELLVRGEERKYVNN